MVKQKNEMMQQKNEMVLRKQEGATLISGIGAQNKQWSVDHWKVELYLLLNRRVLKQIPFLGQYFVNFDQRQCRRPVEL